MPPQNPISTVTLDSKRSPWWRRKIVLIPVLLLGTSILFLVGCWWYYNSPQGLFGSQRQSYNTLSTAESSPSVSILYPSTGVVLSSTQKTRLRWTTPMYLFPDDFNVSLFARVQKQGDINGTQSTPINDGNDFLKGSVEWDIPGYIAHTQLTPGTYKIVWYLQATPKDPARMCSETVGKDCSPNAADRAVMSRASAIKGESGWFDIQERDISTYTTSDFSFGIPEGWGVTSAQEISGGPSMDGHPGDIYLIRSNDTYIGGPSIRIVLPTENYTGQPWDIDNKRGPGEQEFERALSLKNYSDAVYEANGKKNIMVDGHVAVKQWTVVYGGENPSFTATIINIWIRLNSKNYFISSSAHDSSKIETEKALAFVLNTWKFK